MLSSEIQLTPHITIGSGHPLTIIAGPCVIESQEICSEVAERMKKVCTDLNLPYIFKASWDKANRTSIDSFRGLGLEKGLEILAAINKQFDVPTITDIHEAAQAAPVSQVVDIIQIPAFLARQTDLLLSAASTGKTVNVKKGQFMAPEDMRPVLTKLEQGGCRQAMLTERGTTFGYHNLVVDMRSLVTMKSLGVPVVFDCTHSVQLPSADGKSSGGQKEFIAPLTRAATAVGIDALFLEVHPTPDKAKSDGANSLPLDAVDPLLRKVAAIHDA